MENFLVTVLKTATLYYLTFCCCLYIIILIYKIKKRTYLQSSSIVSQSKAVIITAHPDDECMFFSPTLLDLSSRCSVFIICLTTGDYYKKGAVRKQEFFNSCKVLGISKSNTEIIEDSSFPDDPKAPWDYEKLSHVLQEILNRIQANYIFTFDNRGVSGHANHIAISTVIRKISTNLTSSTVYQLDTIPVFRKYIGLLDLPFTLLSRKLTFISSPRNILRSQQAMFAHKSQLEWFRILYIVFSRYMIMNSFTQV